MRVWEDGLVGDRLEWREGGNVDFTRSIKSQGYLIARQKMMMESDEDIYVSLDDDAWFLDEKGMAAAVRVMEGDPKVAAVAFDILSPDRPRLDRGVSLEPSNMFIGCGHALRLEAVRSVGGYEKMPGLYGGEEKDLCLRLIDAGWKIVKLVGVPVWHEKTALMREIKEQRKSGVVNDLTLIARRCPASQLIWNLGGNALNQILFSMRKPGERLIPTLIGLGSFLRQIPKVWATRRPVRRETWKIGRAHV